MASCSPRSLLRAALIVCVAGLLLWAAIHRQDACATGADRKPLQALADVLVESSLSLSREADPVQKAALLDQVAGLLSERARDRALDGDAEVAERLTVCCSRLIEEGILGNLEKVEFKGDTDTARLQSAASALDGVSKGLGVLRRVHDKIPEARRPRIAAAIQACRQRGQGAAERVHRRILEIQSQAKSGQKEAQEKISGKKRPAQTREKQLGVGVGAGQPPRPAQTGGTGKPEPPGKKDAAVPERPSGTADVGKEDSAKKNSDVAKDKAKFVPQPAGQADKKKDDVGKGERKGVHQPEDRGAQPGGVGGDGGGA